MIDAIVELAKVLATPVVAIVALVANLVVSRRFAEISGTKLKFDLFEKRVEMLAILSEILAASRLEEDQYFGSVHDSYQKLQTHKLLFPKNIEADFQRLIALCDEFVGLRADRKSTGATQTTSDGRTIPMVRSQLQERAKALRNGIEDFIRVDWKG